ncbi:MAG: hypothetical protein JWP10_850, partial [Nocardioidaceae bacterium]|nr:hypothetical protein [Nocardioidaceae bacterium]
MSTHHISGHLLPEGTQPTGVRDTDLVATEQHRLPRTLEDFASLPEVAPSASGEVVELLALFGHVVDNGAWDWLGRVFTSNATYVVAGVEVVGLEAIAAHLHQRVVPPSHHTVNSA